MSKIEHLQNCLKDIFDEFTPKFVNKMHWTQLEYRVEGNKRILVFVRVYKKESQKETLKSAMYVVKVEDLDFFAGISGRFINNPCNIEMVSLNVLVQDFTINLKVCIFNFNLHVVYNWINPSARRYFTILSVGSKEKKIPRFCQHTVKWIAQAK